VVLVDPNVLLDVVTNDPEWAGWSQHQLRAAAVTQRLAINAVVYAEASISFARIEGLEAVLDTTGITLVDIPRAASFLAGKTFLAYRRRGGTKMGVLPDFFIGAHAAVARFPLLTRDVRRYRQYFPTAQLIAP
jgi:predicted nucleic acid-binding protein